MSVSEIAKKSSERISITETRKRSRTAEEYQRFLYAIEYILTEIWKSSDVTTAFKNVFSIKPNQKREYFGGAGSSQGKMHFVLINA